ncbi:hypothetical protein FISHEDRAFT_17325, partial [Fistulina hepatica ATCC 64428]
PHMYTDINHHVHVYSCHLYQIYGIHKLEAPLTVLTSVMLFQKVYIDVIYMPK